MSTHYYYIKPYRTEDDARLEQAVKQVDPQVRVRIKSASKTCIQKGLGDRPLKVPRKLFRVDLATYCALWCTIIPFASFKGGPGGLLKPFTTNEYSEILRQPYFDRAERRALVAYHLLIQSELALILRDSMDFVTGFDPRGFAPQQPGSKGSFGTQ